MKKYIYTIIILILIPFFLYSQESATNDKKNKEDKVKKTANGEHTRVLYTQTALQREKGTFSMTNFDLGIFYFDYGITDYLSVGLNVSIPAYFFAIAPSIKGSIKVHDIIHLGAFVQGGSILPVAGSSDMLYFVGGGPILTIGDSYKGINISHLTYYGGTGNRDFGGIDEGGVGASSNISGYIKASKLVRLFLETHIMHNYKEIAKGVTLLYGLRLEGKKFFGDIGFVLPLYDSIYDILKYIPLGFPLVSFGLKF